MGHWIRKCYYRTYLLLLEPPSFLYYQLQCCFFCVIVVVSVAFLEPAYSADEDVGSLFGWCLQLLDVQAPTDSVVTVTVFTSDGSAIGRRERVNSS